MEWTYLDWNEFKESVLLRKLSVQEIQVGTSYVLKAFDGAFKITTRIHTDGEMDSELQDYVATLQTYKNKPPKQAMIRELSKQSIMTNPRTLIFEGVGAHIKKIETETGQFALRGGVLWVPSAGWDFGDTINVRIIDRDDVLGLGSTPENPFIISDYIEQNGLGNGEWGVFPDIANELIDEILSSPMPNGLYICLNYIKANGATGIPKGILNLFTYEI